MDPNQKCITANDAINDSSVSSLASSFVQLEINSHNNTGNGPINNLPNEMMLLIVAKLGLDGDLKKLFQLRLVSTKWRAVIEAYCGQTKSLIVVMDQMGRHGVGFFKDRFPGSTNFKYICLVLSTRMPPECLRSLLNLFPNIVQLSIYCDDRTRIPNFVVHINSLEFLKQLDIRGNIIKALPQLSQTLLSKLEQIGFADQNDEKLSEDEFGRLVSRLGPDCFRFHLLGHQSNNQYYNQIVQWHSINPVWLANLTHLQIGFESTSEWHSKVVHYLVERATSLTHFKANFYPNYLNLTPTVIRNLGKLTRLVELDFWHVEISMSELAVAPHQANTQSSLVTCKFVVSDLRNVRNGAQLTRILSETFPNLVDLDLAFDWNIAHSHFMLFKHETEHNLHLFPKLRKHKINFTSL